MSYRDAAARAIIRTHKALTTPTPVPSEVAETTAGEREEADSRLDAHIASVEHPVPPCRDCEVGEPHVCPLIPAEPDAGEVEALAKALYEQIEWGGCDGASWDRAGSGIRGHWVQAAERLLASDWLAARDDRVRRKEGKRIAQAIEADVFGDVGTRLRAARIARAASVGRWEGL